MSALSLVASVFILRIKECVNHPPPRWLTVASQYLVGVCCCKQRSAGRHHRKSAATQDTNQEQQLLPMTAITDGQSNDHSNLVSCYIDDDDDEVAVTTPKMTKGSNKAFASRSASLINDDSHLIIVAELRALHATMRAAIERKSKRRRAQEKDKNIAYEWDLIARAFDRFLFVVFLAINVAIIVTCSYSTLVYNSQEIAMHRED